MAIAASTLTTGSGTTGTIYNTAAVSPAAGSVVLLTVHGFIAASVQPAAPTISGAGLTWTLVASVDTDNAGTDRATAFLFTGIGTPSSGAITITFASSMSSVGWIVDEFTGVNTSNPVVQSNATTTASGATSASTTLAAFADATNNAAFACFGVQASGADTFTPEAGWTALGASTVTAWCHAFSEWRLGEDTTPSGSWALASRAGIAAVELAAASTTPQGSASGTDAWAGSAIGSSAPATPTGLTATPVSSSQIDLSWNAVSGASGYDIERDGTVIVFDHVGTSYSDTGLNPSTLYTYRVRAVA
jgi:hypothetical protein